MRKFVLSFTMFLALANVAWAQDSADQTELQLAKRLSFYQKKSISLAKHSKVLTRKVSFLNKKNKSLVFKVEELKRDSLQLQTIFQESLTNNQQLVKSYELRIQGMAGELRSLHDSLADLRVVKRDMDLIKHYFDTAPLAQREYSLSISKVAEILRTTLKKENSPYRIRESFNQELVVTEDFDLQRTVFLFIKTNVHVHGEYKIISRPHPFDEGKTLVDIRNIFRSQVDQTSIYDKPEEKLKAETRLLKYIDQAIYANDISTEVSGYRHNK